MIRVECEQGSVVWLAARLGLPTASQFHRLITPKKLERSSSAEGYRNELLAEWLLGQPVDFDASEFMARGTALEAEARRWYEMQRDCDVEQVGFLLHDSRAYGCSPDGLLAGQPIGLEIKCLGAAKHVGYLYALDREPVLSEFSAQIQAGMLVTGYEAWDLLLYSPNLPPALLRYTRDDVFLAKLTPLLEQFCAELREAKESFIRRGYHPPDERVSGWLKEALRIMAQALATPGTQV